MGKIRLISMIVLLVGAKNVMYGQGNSSLATPLNQTIATTTWAPGGGDGAGNWVVQGTNTKTITFTLDPGNQQNLRYGGTLMRMLADGISASWKAAPMELPDPKT